MFSKLAANYRIMYITKEDQAIAVYHSDFTRICDPQIKRSYEIRQEVLVNNQILFHYLPEVFKAL